jgi:hypothetical protein
MLYTREYYDSAALRDASEALKRAADAAYASVSGSSSKSFPCAGQTKAVAAEIAAAQALIKKAAPEK